MVEEPKIVEETQTEETAEPSESIPVGEVETEVDKKKTKSKIGKMWAPLTNQKVYGIIQKLKTALLKIPKSEAYRADGKTSYVAFRVGNRRTFANIHLSPKRAVCRVGRMEGDKTLWDTSFKITEDGIAQNGNAIEISEIVAQAKAFIVSKGWA